MNEQQENLPLWDARPHSKAFARVGLALFLLLLVRLLAQNAIDLGLNALGYTFITEAWWYDYLLSFVPLYAFGLPAMFLVLRTLPKAPYCATYPARQRDGRRVVTEKPRWGFGWFALLVVIALGYMNLGAQLGNNIMLTLSNLVGYDYSNALVSMTDTAPLWATFVFVVILAPIGEEFIFRKLLIDRLRRYGDTAAILLSAFFFALFHGNLYQIFYAFLLGLLLGYLYTRTGKIGWSIGLHAFVNFMGSIVPLTIQSLVDVTAMQELLEAGDIEALMESIMQNPLGYLALMLYSMLVSSMMIASVVLTIVLRRRVKLGQGEVALPRGERLGVAMGNAGMLLAFVLHVLILALSLLPL